MLYICVVYIYISWFLSFSSCRAYFAHKCFSHCIFLINICTDFLCRLLLHQARSLFCPVGYSVCLEALTWLDLSWCHWEQTSVKFKPKYNNFHWRKLIWKCPWWRHQLETFSMLLALCAGNLLVSGEFLSQSPVTLSFDVFFDLCLNKWLSKQSRPRQFEMPLRSLWRHCCDQQDVAHFI